MTDLAEFAQFPEVEAIAMPKTPKASATIRLAICDEGVAWATDFCRRHSDHLGCFEPLGRWGSAPPSRCAPDRESAMEAAIARIRRGIDEPAINAWLASLTKPRAPTPPALPLQLDLFGAAA